MRIEKEEKTYISVGSTSLPITILGREGLIHLRLVLEQLLYVKLPTHENLYCIWNKTSNSFITFLSKC